MLTDSFVALAMLAAASEPTTGPPIMTVYERPAPWFDESSAYSCSYARLVKKDPVWRIDITLPFRGTGSLGLQTTNRFGGENASRVFDLPPEGALVSIPDETAIAQDSPYYFGIGAVSYRFTLEPAALDAMQAVLNDGRDLGISMPGVTKKPYDLLLTRDMLDELRDCQGALGPTLMAARPEGEGPETINRAPIPRPEGKAALRRIQYPSRALRRDEQGRVEALLQIDQFGLPTSCTVSASSGFANLDVSTCRVLERYAKYYPALDDQGEATAGQYQTAIDWRIPN